MPRSTPSAPERPTKALSPRQSQAVILAQQGLDAPAIAAAIAEQDGSEPMNARSVRRLLSDARKRGHTTKPPGKTTRQAKGGKFTDKEPPGRVRCIGVTGGGGAPAMLISPAHETAEERDRRTGGAGRGSLGRDYAPGDLERGPDGKATGRVLVAKSEATLPARSALDAYAPQAERELADASARGARYAVVPTTPDDPDAVEVDGAWYRAEAL
jgi:hypothetical protein